MASSHPQGINSRFDLVKKNIGEENFNFLEFLEILSPSTPKYHIKMHEFQVDALRNCIIDNLFDQGLSLETETSRLLVDFLSNDFNDISKRIYLQVLIHYSKMNVEKSHERYSTSFARSKPTHAELFNALMKAYLKKALMQAEDSSEIVVLAFPEMKELVVTSLLSDAILQAFQSCLKDCLGFTSSIEYLREQIGCMNIYTVKHFVPLSAFRGACLTDGIFICTSHLAGTPDSEIRQADLITLASHECGHYLARISCNNFNFSSPFKLLSGQCNLRQDVVNPELNLEFGRAVELYLFDKIQPDWFVSSEHAAIKFLDRLKTYTTCPIIKEEEIEGLRLRDRSYVSPTFGIDTVEYDVYF